MQLSRMMGRLLCLGNVPDEKSDFHLILTDVHRLKPAARDAERMQQAWSESCDAEVRTTSEWDAEIVHTLDVFRSEVIDSLKVGQGQGR